MTEAATHPPPDEDSAAGQNRQQHRSWESGDDSSQVLAGNSDTESYSDDSDDDFEIMSPVAFQFMAGSLDDPVNAHIQKEFKEVGPVTLAFMTTSKINIERKHKDYNIFKLVTMSNTLRLVYLHINPEEEPESEEEPDSPEVQVYSEKSDIEEVMKVLDNVLENDDDDILVIGSVEDSQPEKESVTAATLAKAAKSTTKPRILYLGKSKSLYGFARQSSSLSHELKERGYSSDGDSSKRIKKLSKKFIVIPERPNAPPQRKASVKLSVSQMPILPPEEEIPPVPPIPATLTPFVIPPRASSRYQQPSRPLPPPPPVMLEKSSSLLALRSSFLSRSPPPSTPTSPTPVEPETMFGSVKRRLESLSSFIPSIRSVTGATTIVPRKSLESHSEAPSPPPRPPVIPSRSQTSPVPAIASRFTLPVNSFMRRPSTEETKLPEPISSGKSRPTGLMSFAKPGPKSQATVSPMPTPTSKRDSASSSARNSIADLDVPHLFDMDDPNSVESEVAVVNEMKRKSAENKKRQSSRLSVVSTSLDDISSLTPGGGVTRQRSRKSATAKHSRLEFDGLEGDFFKDDDPDPMPTTLPTNLPPFQLPVRRTSKPDERLSLNESAPVDTTAPFPLPVRRTSKPDATLSLNSLNDGTDGEDSFDSSFMFMMRRKSKPEGKLSLNSGNDGDSESLAESTTASVSSSRSKNRQVVVVEGDAILPSRFGSIIRPFSLGTSSTGNSPPSTPPAPPPRKYAPIVSVTSMLMEIPKRSSSRILKTSEEE
ncbi:hypothetical protein BCR33DRAFT_711298 [Rhizoclosmatium globosum]|uniref:Uncharacterized protein n=1 Tax=Rhizoclosmatium globosum TaxID=329046 RepID=A0A1Y2D0S8_9FUNG|nr:hypothetical protein BCR33DRAFT_711298 [Rhizoclosmatium globosum]|eukprot:ORY52878.1 hypothetical protein BCR33DRAFT_711298 [Rhizoclosmatium globosum]